MNTFVKISAIVLAAIATLTALPIADPDVQKIADIATLSCQESVATSQVADETNNEIVIQVLQDELSETVDEINIILNNASSWTTAGEDLSKLCPTLSLNIPAVNHQELDANQNLRLQNLLNMSMYAHFFEGQGNDTTSYSNIAPRLDSLQVNIRNIAQTLGELLPMVTCDAITEYVNQDLSGWSLTTPDKARHVECKRAVVYRTLTTLLQALTDPSRFI